jgi:hypothetical protein
LRNEYEISERRACQAIQMHRSSYRYVGQQEFVDAAYREVIRLSDRYSYFGYRKIYDLMRGSWTISRERVRLIRRHEGLQVARKRRKKKCLGMTTQWVHRAEYPNHVWSYDFVFDQTEDGRQLNSLTATDVTRILDELFSEHGRPVCIRSDNGPELVAKHVQN